MDFKPKGIVIHAMGQWIEWEDEMLFAPDFIDRIGLSANGYIDVDGTYIEGSPKGFKTKHAGVSYHKEKALGGLNTKYIGYEVLVENAKNIDELYHQMENNPGVYTNEQYLTLAKKCYQDMTAFNFDTSFIIGHDEVAGIDVRGEVDYKRDPGPFFDYDKLKGYIEMEKYG